MTTAGYRRLLFALSAAVAALLACTCSLVLKYADLRMETDGAWRVISEYNGIRFHLGELSVIGVTDRLDTTVRSGLNFKNPALKRVVEHERARMIRDLIADLRMKTGQNLGDDPVPWIRKYLAVDGQRGASSEPGPELPPGNAPDH